jgi:hypothetical protein
MKTTRKQNLPAAARQKSSAGFQPAVSPTCSRQTLGESRDVQSSRRVRIGNPRYSRLEVCATIALLGAFTQAVYDEAQKAGWTVVSMKNDWKSVFAPEKK